MLGLGMVVTIIMIICFIMLMLNVCVCGLWRRVFAIKENNTHYRENIIKYFNYKIQYIDKGTWYIPFHYPNRYNSILISRIT